MKLSHGDIVIWRNSFTVLRLLGALLRNRYGDTVKLSHGDIVIWSLSFTVLRPLGDVL